MKYMSSVDTTCEKQVAKQYKAQTSPYQASVTDNNKLRPNGGSRRRAGGDSSLKQQHFSKFSGNFDKFQAMDQFLGARPLKTNVWIHPAALC